MSWNDELAFRITPKSGPLRPLETLLDASRAMMQDLTPGDRKKPLWRAAGWAVVAAADSSDAETIRATTECLIAALDSEGWMTTQRGAAIDPLQDCLAALSADLSACITAGAKSRWKPDLRIVEGSRRQIAAEPARKAVHVRATPLALPLRLDQTA